MVPRQKTDGALHSDGLTWQRIVCQHLCRLVPNPRWHLLQERSVVKPLVRKLGFDEFEQFVHSDKAIVVRLQDHRRSFAVVHNPSKQPLKRQKGIYIYKSRNGRIIRCLIGMHKERKRRPTD